MRGYLFLFILVLGSFCSFGQFLKNTTYLSGFGSYSFDRSSNSSKVGKYSSDDFLVGISPGYFIFNKLAVGATFNWIRNRHESSVAFVSPNIFYQAVNNEVLSDSWVVGPFARYYFFKGLFVEADYLIGKAKIEEETLVLIKLSPDPSFSSTYTESRQKVKANMFVVGLGYSLIVSKSRNLGIDLSAFYRYQRQSSEYQSQKNVGFNGLSVNLSVSGFLFKPKV